MYGQMQNFYYFPLQFGLLVIKAMAFWEISPLALLHALKLCLMYGQMQNFYYFPSLVWCDGCQSQGI